MCGVWSHDHQVCRAGWKSTQLRKRNTQTNKQTNHSICFILDLAITCCLQESQHDLFTKPCSRRCGCKTSWRSCTSRLWRWKIIPDYKNKKQQQQKIAFELGVSCPSKTVRRQSLCSLRNICFSTLEAGDCRVCLAGGWARSVLHFTQQQTGENTTDRRGRQEEEQGCFCGAGSLFVLKTAFLWKERN